MPCFSFEKEKPGYCKIIEWWDNIKNGKRAFKKGTENINKIRKRKMAFRNSQKDFRKITKVVWKIDWLAKIFKVKVTTVESTDAEY